MIVGDCETLSAHDPVNEDGVDTCEDCDPSLGTYYMDADPDEGAWMTLHNPL